MSSLAFESVSETPAVKPRRKAVLQWLFLVGLVGCFFLVLWVNREARALARYQRLGARFYYKTSIPNLPVPGPAAAVIRSLPMFRTVTGIDLTASKVRDSDLAGLKHVRQLRSLNLSHTEITDQGLKHLYGLDQLESVQLRQTRVTPEGVEALQRARPKLFIGSLQENRAIIPHRWLPTVVANPSNRRVRFVCIDFSDSRSLQGKRHATAGDADVERAAMLMKEMLHLRSINLSGTNVTDDGLRHLTALTNLKEIDLRNTRVTDQGAERLQTELPGATLSR